MFAITVPKTIQIRNLVNKDDKGIDISFSSYVLQMLHDKKFGGSIAALRSASQLQVIFEDITEGTTILVHPNDYTLLKDVAQDPSGGFQNPGVAMQLLPYIDAIVDAKKAEPKPKE